MWKRQDTSGRCPKITNLWFAEKALKTQSMRCERSIVMMIKQCLRTVFWKRNSLHNKAGIRGIIFVIHETSYSRRRPSGYLCFEFQILIIADNAKIREAGSNSYHAFFKRCTSNCVSLADLALLLHILLVDVLNCGLTAVSVENGNLQKDSALLFTVYGNVRKSAKSNN
jgi:hypothetical protein